MRFLLGEPVLDFCSRLIRQTISVMIIDKEIEVTADTNNMTPNEALPLLSASLNGSRSGWWLVSINELNRIS